MIDPNPLILSRSDGIHSRGVVNLKNETDRLLLFHVDFNPDIFCSISPVSGEVEANSTQKLNFALENAMIQEEEITFSVKYALVPLSTDSETKSQMRLDQSSWKGFSTAKIHFSSHAEDAIQNLTQILKSKPSFSRAISETENRKSNEEMKFEMMKKKLREKIAQNEQLKAREQTLQIQVNEIKEQIKIFQEKPNKEQTLNIIAFIIFILSIIIHFSH